jgi:putative ABC transport system ATP-binding protein
MNSVSSIATESAISTTTTVIQVEQLDHFFGKGELRKQVLFGINLSIAAGEIVILTGPSGSGKTTLLSLMGGLRSPQSGSLCMLDTELVGAAKSVAVEARRSCGYIFQAHNLHSSLTAQENVMIGLEVHDTTPKICRADKSSGSRLPALW